MNPPITNWASNWIFRDGESLDLYPVQDGDIFVIFYFSRRTTAIPDLSELDSQLLSTEPQVNCEGNYEILF